MAERDLIQLQLNQATSDEEDDQEKITRLTNELNAQTPGLRNFWPHWKQANADLQSLRIETAEAARMAAEFERDARQLALAAAVAAQSAAAKVVVDAQNTKNRIEEHVGSVELLARNARGLYDALDAELARQMADPDADPAYIQQLQTELAEADAARQYYDYQLHLAAMDLASINAYLEEVQKVLDAANVELERAREHLETAASYAELQKLRATALTSLGAAEAALEVAEAAQAIAESAHDLATTEHDAIQEQLDEAKAAMPMDQDKVDQLTAQLAAQATTLASRQADLDAANSVLTQARDSLDTANTDLDQDLENIETAQRLAGLRGSGLRSRTRKPTRPFRLLTRQS